MELSISRRVSGGRILSGYLDDVKVTCTDLALIRDLIGSEGRSEGAVEMHNSFWES